MKSTCRLIAAFAAVAALSTATQALADSRLFSARTDKPDVTIDQVAINGRPLTVAGKGGGVTFFRIENPSGAIPCTANMIFTASNGLRSSASVDLCAANWEITLPARMSWTPLPGPGPGPGPVAGPGPVTPPPGTRAVTVATDDPATRISEVYLDRQPMPIISRGGNSVQIAVPGSPGGITCQRDLGLRLADGRSIARRVNICANSWSVLVMVAGDVAPPNPNPPPTSTPEPGPVALGLWSVSSSGGNVTLALGYPGTNRTELVAGCRQGTGQATVTVTRGVPGLLAGRPINVTMSAGAFTDTYSGVGTPYDPSAGGSQPRFSTDVTDALWNAMIAEAALNVGIGSRPPYALSLKGSSSPTRQFLAACRPAPVVVNPGPFPPPGPGPGPGPGPAGFGMVFSCDDGSEIRVAFSSGGGPVRISEGYAPGRVLPRAPSEGDIDVWEAGPFRLEGADEEIHYMRPGAPPRACRPS